MPRQLPWHFTCLTSIYTYVLHVEQGTVIYQTNAHFTFLSLAQYNKLLLCSYLLKNVVLIILVTYNVP